MDMINSLLRKDDIVEVRTVRFFSVVGLFYILIVMGSHGTALPIRRDASGDNSYSEETFSREKSESFEESFVHCCGVESDEDSTPSDETMSDEDPGEYGDFLEGDMIMPNTGRTGYIDPIKHWINATLVYQIIANFTIQEKQDFETSMRHISSNTCIRFRERMKQDRDYIEITNTGSGCYAYTGRRGGAQPLNLHPLCFQKIGTVIHEILHAVGIVHEHTRPDREDWIIINFANIQDGKEPNFNAKSWEEVTAFGEPYDYGSVMHYSNIGFARNKSIPTISKKMNNSDFMGQRERMSPIDIKKVNKMYKCSKEPPPLIDAIEFCGD